MREQWKDFVPGVWEKEINVRDFIQKNYTPYDGGDECLPGPTQRPTELWAQVMDLTRAEREAGGVLVADAVKISIEAEFTAPTAA